MTNSLLLGPVLFLAFEMPERIGFGGSQRLAIHRLPGGGRVIDALGRDDADITWSGIFTGPDAADRARLLDALRAEGDALPLTWDAFFYSVVIARFEADYAKQNWVPYKLTCTVLRDEAAAAAVAAPDLAGSLLADLTSAAASQASLALIAAPGATTRGTGAYAMANTAIAADTASRDAAVTAAETAMSSITPNTPATLSAICASAGNLAAAVQSRAMLGRASRNLVNANT